MLDGIITSAGITELGEEEQGDAALDAAAGLTTVEAENAFALSAGGTEWRRGRAL